MTKDSMDNQEDAVAPPTAEELLSWQEANRDVFIEHRHGNFQLRRGNETLTGFHRTLRAALAEAVVKEKREQQPWPAAHTPQWFERCFEDAKSPIPPDVRKAAERIVETHDIRGICDPMYVANVIAVQMKRGDGCSNFEQDPPFYGEDPAGRDERPGCLDRAVGQLAHAYSSSRGVTKEAIKQALIEQLRY